MNRELQKLVDAPLADPLKLYLPQGTRSAKKAPKVEYYDTVAAPRISRAKLAERRVDEYSTKLTAVLDYYGTTSVPFDRIAEHTKLTVEQVTESMARRGRMS